MAEITNDWIKRLNHYTDLVDNQLVSDECEIDISTRSAICALLGYLSSIEILETEPDEIKVKK